MSPLRCAPLARFFSTPPRRSKMSACFGTSCPWIDGASDRPSCSSTSCSLASVLMFDRSALEKAWLLSSLLSFLTDRPQTIARKKPLIDPLALGAMAL
eukprot:scaffold105948_cov36-Prasinocladus_malaysianus.AAC.1